MLIPTFNLPDISPSRQVVEFQAPTAENNYTWYRLYSDGWVEQGGMVQAYGTATVSLPVAMNDTKYTILLGNRSGSYEQVLSLNPKTATFQIKCAATNDTSSCWQVSGMSARSATQQNILCIKY